MGDGSDQDIDFGDWPSGPPAIFDFISSVTFAITNGDGQEARLFRAHGLLGLDEGTVKFGTTSSGKVQSVSCGLLSDPQDSKIHHVHRVVTIEDAARSKHVQLAKELGLDTARLQVLHVEQDALASGPVIPWIQLPASW